MNEAFYLLNIIPAVVVAGLAIYFLRMFFNNEERRRRVMLLETLKKETTPMRFQAYERLVIFLERIHPPKLLLRIPDNRGISKESYAAQLIDAIEKEYDYNLSQQLYITSECWKMVELAKHTVVKAIRVSASDDDVKDCVALKTQLLKNVEEDLPTCKALRYVKGEAQKLW